MANGTAAVPALGWIAKEGGWRWVERHANGCCWVGLVGLPETGRAQQLEPMEHVPSNLGPGLCTHPIVSETAILGRERLVIHSSSLSPQNHGEEPFERHSLGFERKDRKEPMPFRGKRKPKEPRTKGKTKGEMRLGSFFSEARQVGRADPPCHVGMAVEKEGGRTVPCVNVLRSYDMRSSVLRKAKDRHESKSSNSARDPQG